MFFRNLIPLFLLIGGFVGSEFLSARGIDTGLRWENINPLIMHLCVPVILFHLALKIPSKGLRQEWKPALAYAVFAGAGFVLLSAAVLSALLGSSSGFPLSAALLAACLLMISDMSAVPEIRGGLLSCDPTRQRLEIESLILGTLGGTYFTAFVLPDVALNPLFWTIELISAAMVSLSLAFLGGVLLQLFFGQTKGSSRTVIKLLAVVTALLGLNAAVIYFEGSTTLFAVVLALSSRNLVSDVFWRPVNGLAVIALLIIAGASFTPELFTDRWLAMLIGAGLVVMGRIITVLPTFWLIYEAGTRISDNEPWLATFAAPRGAITLALAISIPLDFAGWYTVQAVVFGGVVASMLSATLSAIFLQHQVKT